MKKFILVFLAIASSAFAQNPATPYTLVNRVKPISGQTEIVIEPGLVFSASQKFQLPAFTSDPGSPVAGQLWYNSTSGTVKARAGGVTISLSGGGGGGGSVNSVAQTFTGGLISVAGSPVTDNGTLALTVAGTSGGIPYFSSASTWASSAALTSNSLILGGGAGNAPKVAAGIATDGTSRISLGVNGASTGALKLFGATSGNVLLKPNDAAGTDIVHTLPATSGTLLNTGTTIAVAQGGTGLASIGSALQVLRVNAAGTALEYGSAPAAAAGALTGTTLAAGVVNSSLETLGTLTALDVAAASTLNLAAPSHDININSGGQLNLVGASQLNVVAPLLNFVGATSGIVVQFKDAASIVEITAANGMTLNGSQVLTNGGALGAPSSGTLTNCTDLPIIAGTTGTLSVARGGTGITSFGSGVATFLGTPSSANLLAALTTKTGTGNAVFATSPTLVTPILGTPQSVTLTNGTGLPISTGVTGLNTGVATLLGSYATSSSTNRFSVVGPNAAESLRLAGSGGGGAYLQTFSGSSAYMTQSAYYDGAVWRKTGSGTTTVLFGAFGGVIRLYTNEGISTTDGTSFSPVERFSLDSAGATFSVPINVPKTITAGGTTGAQTINKMSGSVNFAAGATSLVVTNSTVATSSVIICTVRTNDSTMKSVAAVGGSGSFTLHANAAATAETRVDFLITN